MWLIVAWLLESHALLDTLSLWNSTVEDGEAKANSVRSAVAGAEPTECQNWRGP